MILTHLTTYITKKRLWVSTVAHDMEIGLDRTSETMSFRGNKKGITSYRDKYFESHGHTQNKELLKDLHERIVKKLS